MAPNILKLKKFNCSRLVGVEWEFNDMTSYTALDAWVRKWGGEVHPDGSCGDEVVTPPIFGDDIDACLGDLHKAFVMGHAMIDQRCGIHVHVDAADLGWDDIVRLLEVYAKLEPLLFLLGGQNRLSNQYCSPVGEHYMKYINYSRRVGEPVKYGVMKALFGYSMTDSHVDAAYQMRSGLSKKGGNRYRAINILPWMAQRRWRARDTTIEFRLHKHAVSGERVIGWTKVLARLVDWVANHSDNDVKNLPKSPLRTLCKVIAPDMESWILGRIREWRSVTAHNAPEETRIPRRFSFEGGAIKIRNVTY